MKRTEAIEQLQNCIDLIKQDGQDYLDDRDIPLLNMAIEALKEQEISNELQEYAYECGYEHFFHECQNCEHRRIENKADKWIPITEAEPNTTDHVLVTYKWDDDDYETSELDYWVNKYEAEHGNERCKFFYDHIIAWQLKPMPYRETDFEWQKEE